MQRWISKLGVLNRFREWRSKGSIVRSALIVLLVISLIPFILIGTLTAYRSQATMRRQVAVQMENIVRNQVTTLEEYVKTREAVFDGLLTDGAFQGHMFTLLNFPVTSIDHELARTAVRTDFSLNLGARGTGLFNHMLLFRPDGSVVLTSDEEWLVRLGGERLNNASLRALSGTNQSMFLYNKIPGYENKLALVIVRSLKDETGRHNGNLILISTSDLLYRTLKDSGAFLKSAQPNYFTSDMQFVEAGQFGLLMPLPENPGVAEQLQSLISENRIRQPIEAISYYNSPVTGFVEWMPKYNIGVLLTVSVQAMMEQNSPYDPITFILLFVSLVISSVLIYFATSQLVNPLVQLSQVAETFAKGNFETRARIKRQDELGMLARSFNKMADELSEMYRSLESVVENRTRQIRLAAEVAQLASSTTRLSDTLTRTTDLIAERFGFYHVSIYLTDESGKSLVLRESSGTAGEEIRERGDRVEINTSTLPGLVASINQPRVITDVQHDPAFRFNELLPDTLSEAAVPISVGSEVLGVLNIHSTLIDAFDEELVNVIQTLANQISGTLQNNRLLEATQVSYQETALLYRATRQVTQSRSEADVVQSVVDTLIQLPFLGALLSVEGENFKINVLTDAKAGRVDKSLQSLNIPVGRMAETLAESRLVVIQDISQSSGYENMVSFLMRRGCKAAALLAVLENGRLTKVLALGAHDEKSLTQPVLQPYVNLAEVVGATLEKFRVLNTLQQRLSELQILASFAQAVTAENILPSLYRVLHEQVIQTLGPDLEFAIALFDEKAGEIEFPYFVSGGVALSVPPSQLGEGLTSILIQSQKPLLLEDRAAIQGYSSKRVGNGRPAQSWMGLPLMYSGKAIGAIIIQDLQNENRFNQDDLNLFMALAPQMSTAVRNAQLYTESQSALSAYDQERFLLNTLLDSMPEGISFKDMEGRYIRASESVARIYGQPVDALVGKTDYDLMDRELADQFFREEQAVMNSGEAEIGLVQYHVVDGQELWTHTSRIPIRTLQGEPYGLLIIQRDVTELKRAEALSQHRAEQVLTAAEIARDTTGTLDVDVLLGKAVNLVRERFGFYHASIFLLDAAGDYAILRESTGLAGEQMRRAGHRLAVGSRSIVGSVTLTGESMIVNNVVNDPNHFANPLLPETRSELAIPLKIGERILGAVDVQSTQASAFNAEDVAVLQILADQLAVAVANGELFASTHELLRKHRLLREISVEASATSSMDDALMSVVHSLLEAKICDRIGIMMLEPDGRLHTRATAGYQNQDFNTHSLAIGEGIIGTAAQEKQPILIADTMLDPRYISIDQSVRSELAIPILFGDELLGVLNLESTQAYAFDENDEEILGALGNNVGGVIANIRLVSQVRQQVIRERQLYEVTSKIRHSVNLEAILETSAREIAKALGARRAQIQITAGRAAATEAAEDVEQTAPPTQQIKIGPNGSANGKGMNGSSNGGNGHRNGSNHDNEVDA